MELLEDRPRALPPPRMPCGDERLVPLGRVLLLRLALHVVEQFDPRQRLVRPRRVTGPGLVELPSRVHHTPDLDDRSRGEQPVVGRVRIGLEIALEALEDRRRAGATAVRRVMINYIGMVV